MQKYIFYALPSLNTFREQKYGRKKRVWLEIAILGFAAQTISTLYTGRKGSSALRLNKEKWAIE